MNTSLPPLNPEALNKFIGNDLAQHKEFLMAFIPQAITIIDEMKTALQEQNIKHVGELGHKLKSSCHMVGATDLAQSCQKIELAGQCAKEEEVKSLLPHIISQFEYVKNFIEKTYL